MTYMALHCGYHPLPSHPLLFSPSLILFQEHWFLASFQTFQSCVCLRDFVMTVPSDWKILPLATHLMSHFLQVFAQIFFSEANLITPFQLQFHHQNSWYVFPCPFTHNIYQLLSYSPFHLFLLSVVWLFPVECKLHQGKDLFFLIPWGIPRHTAAIYKP